MTPMELFAYIVAVACGLVVFALLAMGCVIIWFAVLGWLGADVNRGGKQ